VSFAFVAIVRGKTDVWTMGMHVLGLRDIVMKRADVEEEGFDIVEVICYLARGDKPVGDGHIIADLDGPRFQCYAEDGDAKMAGTPMYNPFGRLRLVNMRDISMNN
jgi:phage terminase Nu1 subunit (DNA packaging protein)